MLAVKRWRVGAVLKWELQTSSTVDTILFSDTFIEPISNALSGSVST